MLCQILPTIHHLAMKSALWFSFSCALLLMVSGCANNNKTAGNDPLGTGPFDSRGNYREDWADDPSKWRKGGASSQPEPADDLPQVAKNEEPPPNANPLAPQGATLTKTTPRRTGTSTRETVVRESTRKPVETKTRESNTVSATPKPKPAVAETKPKAKSKPKPKTTRYVVKKGDSLSTIASRNGTSVSAIKSVNGISGTLIRPGQSLVIPKR